MCGACKTHILARYQLYQVQILLQEVEPVGLLWELIFLKLDPVPVVEVVVEAPHKEEVDPVPDPPLQLVQVYFAQKYAERVD